MSKSGSSSVLTRPVNESKNPIIIVVKKKSNNIAIFGKSKKKNNK